MLLPATRCLASQAPISSVHAFPCILPMVLVLLMAVHRKEPIPSMVWRRRQSHRGPLIIFLFRPQVSYWPSRSSRLRNKTLPHAHAPTCCCGSANVGETPVLTP